MTPGTHVTIGLVQDAVTGDQTQTLTATIARIREAAGRGAQIICLKELFNAPYFCKSLKQEYFNFAEAIPGHTTEVLRAAAAELQVVLIVPMYERQGPGIYRNSAAVIDADGSLLGRTRMIHITEYACFHETGYYSPGDTGAPVYETKAGRIGVAICYDRHYPEYMRALALAGAELVVVPQAGSVGEWPEGLYEAEMRVAAFQNGYWVALCNRVGKEEKLTFAGESFVCRPDGTVTARAKLGTDEILYAEVDLRQNEESNARRLFLRDRRPELYAEWMAR